MSYFKKLIKQGHTNFKSVLYLAIEIGYFLTLKKITQKFSKTETIYKKVLIDGHFNNLGYWYRLQLFRASLGLKKTNETAYVWKWQSFSCIIILKFLGIGNIVKLYKNPSEKTLIEAKEILAKIKNSNDFFDINLPYGIPPSVLYDEMLKRLKAPYVDFKNPECVNIISEFLEAIKSAANIIEKLQPELVILSHTIGSQCAPICWIAASKNILVINLWGKYGLLRATKVKTPQEIFESEDRPYYKDFSKLSPAKLKKLEKVGRKYLQARFEGKTDDIGSHYAFPKTEIKISNDFELNKPVIAVYASNWFDYPHLYGMSNFRDFHDWICETKKIAEMRSDCIWLFKSHPADQWYGGPGLKDIFEKSNSPHIFVLDETVPSRQIIDIADGLITFHGSAGVEFSALGKPVLLADNGWYHDWNFCLSVKSRSDYINKLKSNWFEKSISNEEKRRANVFSGACYCCPDWQSNLILKDDADRGQLRKQIPKLVKNNSIPLIREIGMISEWVLDDSQRYHSTKMIQAQTFKLSNVVEY